MTNADYGYLLQSVGNRQTNTGNSAAPNVRTYTRIEDWIAKEVTGNGYTGYVKSNGFRYWFTKTTSATQLGRPLLTSIMKQAETSKEPLALKFMSVIASISLTYGLPYASMNSQLLVKKFIGGG